MYDVSRREQCASIVECCSTVGPVWVSAGGPPSTGPVDGFGGWSGWEPGSLRGEEVNPISAPTEVEEDIHSSSESSNATFGLKLRDEMKLANWSFPQN